MNSRLVIRRIKNSFKYMIRKPFKGSTAYEWQIMGFVFLLQYPKRKFFYEGDAKWKLTFFYDKFWNL